jgi:hypothetical protein
MEKTGSSGSNLSYPKGSRLSNTQSSIKGSSQKQNLVTHLNTVPEGAKSQKKVRFIRLINKSKLLQKCPLISKLVLEIRNILNGLQLEYGNNDYFQYTPSLNPQ